MRPEHKAEFREGKTVAREFELAMKKILSVPKEEVDRIKEEEKRPKRKG